MAVGQYLEGLKMRALAQEMVATWGGKMPHVAGFVVGGCTATPTAEEIETFKKKLAIVKKFVDETYVPTVYLVAGAYKDLFGVGDGLQEFYGPRCLPPG